MTFKLLNKQGVQALDPNQLIELIKGNGVISGLEVTLDTNLTLNISSGDVIVNGTLYQLSSDSLTLDTADTTHPRKDIIWINEVGQITYTAGVPEEISPSGSNRFDSATPSPVSLAGSTGVVLAEIFVDTNQTELVSDDIRDRRLFTQLGGLGGQTEEFDNGDSGTNTTIDWNNGRHQKITLTDNCEFTFTDPNFIGRYDIRIIQGNGGEHNLTFSNINIIFPDSEPEWNQGKEGDEIILTVRFDGNKYILFDSGYYEVIE